MSYLYSHELSLTAERFVSYLMAETKHGIPDGQRRRLVIGPEVGGVITFLEAWRDGDHTFIEDAAGKQHVLTQVNSVRYRISRPVRGKKRREAVGEFTTEAHRAFAEWRAAHWLLNNGGIKLHETKMRARRR